MLWSDLKLAVRGLIGAPGLSAAAVVALAVGIGPNTAIFSIVYATLLAPRKKVSEPTRVGSR
jgi:putative ABC transport system permease protein